MTTLTLNYRTARHKLKSIAVPRMDLRLLYFLAVMLFLSMLVLYIININQLTKGAYLIKNYNKDVSALVEENGVLQARFAESDFLGAVQERARALSFEKTSQIHYVQMVESSLGMAQ